MNRSKLPVPTFVILVLGFLVSGYSETFKGKTVFVKSPSVDVKIKNDVVGVARKGDRITVVSERGAWLGVHFTDTSGKAIRGWILSKHVTTKSDTPVVVRPKPKPVEVKPKTERPTTRLLSVDRLASEFRRGSKEERERLYNHLDQSKQLEKASAELSKTALPVARQFFEDLSLKGREQLLADHYRSDFVERIGSRDKAFDEQLAYEKYAADYTGVWPEHHYMIKTGIVIGLKPKSRKVLELMNEAKPDEFGTPAWVKSGPILYLAPEEGKWKIVTAQRMAYAYNITKMLRRQAEELK